jgi:signal transduction histidine kinase
MNTLAHSDADIRGLSYWRNKLFSRILLYSLPVSFIALVPGVIMSIKGGIPLLAVYDILAIVSLAIIALYPRLSLSMRKTLFVIILYLMAIILLIYLGSFGPGLLYLLAITIFITLIFRRSIAYGSIAVNAGICLLFAIVIYFKLLDSPLANIYTLGSWIAVSSNLIFLNTVIVASLHLLFSGLQATIVKENELTKQLNAESKALERMLNVLQTKNQELEQFAYIASHDLQEPLQTISSFADLLEKLYKEKLDERAVIYLGYLSQSTARMRSLITGLLEYARIGREKQLEQVDCNKIVQDVIHDLDATITESKVTISIHSLPSLEAYPVELKQLFQNLISNAIKFRKKEVPLKIIIEAKEEDNYWTFSVTDNGIGIDEKFHEKIFIIFQRLHTRSKYEGTGIGLAYCKKIVELHGGKIWVESNPTVGSIFYFSIPKTDNDHGSKIKVHSAH